MKLLIQKPAVFFFLTILIFFGTYNTGYGQAAAIDPPLSERTPQIRDAIVAAVPDVNSADDVTAAHLATITTLKPGVGLGAVSVTSLKAGDFNGLTALTYLNLSGNGDPIGNISVLGDLTTLTTLFLAGRSISDLSFLEDLTTLKTLYLTHNSITDISGLAKLTALTELSVGENSVTDISVLENLTKLKTLILETNSISDISALENLTKLTSLYLAYNSITDISILEDFTGLKTLMVRGNPIADYAPLHRLKAAVAAAGSDIHIDLHPPAFTDGTSTTRTIPENTAAGTNIGTAISATDADDRTLTYNLSGTDAAAFRIVSTSGQLQTSAALDFETKSSYSVTVDVSDGKIGSASIAVTIHVSDVNEAPVFPQGRQATLAVAENTAPGTNIGVAFTATDPDAGDTLTYSLRRGDRDSFSINPNTGQLQTKAALDYETKRTYDALAVRVTDSEGLIDAIVVTINVTDVNENRTPTFNARSVTRAVAENTASGTNIGAAIAATDADNDTLTYSISGADAPSFSIVSTSGQLQTKAALDYETKASYTVIVSVSDGNGGSDSITVTIDITDVNENRAPVFSDGDTTTRSVTENIDSGKIGSAIAATDADNDTLIYSISGADAAAFRIVRKSGQLRIRAALDYEAKSSYTVIVSVSDGNGGSDSITVTINVMDVDENRAPVFSDGDTATRSVAENTASGTNIGAAIAATDADTSDTLTYSLSGTDASSFSIVSDSGQLQTKAALDYETKTSYSVTISVSDDNGGSDSITVTINITDVNENRAPVFTDGSTTTRSVAENTASGTNIGTAIAATDADNDTLTYSLDGTDAAAFSIVSTSGQLQTKEALDYETKPSYSVAVSVSDGNSGSASIAVTINVTDVNENRAPAFTDGTNTTRSVAENTASGTNIGTAITATDADSDTLTYSLGGTDAASFSIVSDSGQLQTKAALDYETKTTYSVTVSVSDDNGGSASIAVTINITDVNENRAPVFTEGNITTRSVAENTASDTNIGAAVAATDADNDTLTYSLSGTDASSFSIVSTSGQLQTKAALDYETKASYAVAISVSDGKGGSDSITITINVTDVNENRAPVFTDGTSATRAVAENTAAGTNIGVAIAATDADSADTLTYSLAGTDAASFSIVSTSGQLQTNAALDYETKSSYTVIVSVSDGNGGSDSITVTINVTDVTEVSFVAVANRTPQVRDAIVKEAGANSADEVTPDDVASITYLDLSHKKITSLKTGDFSGLTRLAKLRLNDNSISDVSALSDLTSLTFLRLYNNSISDISSLSSLTKLTILEAGNNSISNISVIENWTKLTHLNMSRNSISDMSAVEDLTSLTDLIVSDNSISDMSAVEDLTNLRELDLNLNSIRDISAVEDLTKLTVLELGYNSISDISAVNGLTRLMILGLSSNKVADLSPIEDLTMLQYLYLSGNPIADLSPIEDLTALQYLYLNGNPISDYAPLRRLKVAIGVIEGHPGLNLDVTIPVVPNNNAPVFTDGDSTTRSIAENTDSGTNIGRVVAATDVDAEDTLTYHLGGTDAGSFRIVRTSGQLQTNAALDHETKDSYTVVIAVSDGKGGSDSITVTITVTEAVGAAPSVQTPPALPQTTELLSNFPNPFNPETWIPYQLAEPAEVTLTIYDVRGRVVRTLRLGNQPAGMYRSRSTAAHWDGRNHLGEKVATGVYFYTLEAGDYAATRKLLIRK